MPLNKVSPIKIAAPIRSLKNTIVAGGMEVIAISMSVNEAPQRKDKTMSRKISGKSFVDE